MANDPGNFVDPSGMSAVGAASSTAGETGGEGETYLDHGYDAGTSGPREEDNGKVQPLDNNQEEEIENAEEVAPSADDPSTDVKKNDDGTYTVTGGKPDGDKNIYLLNGNGIRSEIIGQSATEYSFLSETGKPILGAIINPNDHSGENFINNSIIGGSPSLINYMVNARNGEKYDFKDIGIRNRPESMSVDQYRYRGVPLNDVKGLGNGVKIFGSARDVGNFGAGYVAGRSGLSWATARYGFDAYQSKSFNVKKVEGITTQLAERVGWNLGIRAYNQIVQKTIQGTSQSPFQK